jgi:hypothetical protein
MKPRHAAALVLVGWYLMMPPPYGPKTNPGAAPLGQWTVFGRYDSARECSDERTKMIRVQSMALLSDLVEGVSDANLPSLSLDFKHAQCIASDDPRLKEKQRRAARRGEQSKEPAPATPGVNRHGVWGRDYLAYEYQGYEKTVSASA